MVERSVLTTEFNDRMRQLDQLGSWQTAAGERVHRTFNGRDQEAKIRKLQKECNQILELKARDNRRRGRFLGDGKDF